MALFLEEALANYPSVASVTPSSRHLARAMAEPLRKMKVGVVVELGAGTGVITRASSSSFERIVIPTPANCELGWND